MSENNVGSVGHKLASITMSADDVREMRMELAQIGLSDDNEKGFNPVELERAQAYLAKFGITAGVNETTIKRFLDDTGAAVNKVHTAQPRVTCVGPEDQKACTITPENPAIEILTIDGAFALVNVGGEQGADAALSAAGSFLLGISIVGQSTYNTPCR